MRFGIFHTPFHLPNTQNPNLALRRDVELVKLYDMLGFDEVWFGEHHSGGCELIVDPLTFIAHVAPQTQRIKLGTTLCGSPSGSSSSITSRVGAPSTVWALVRCPRTRT
jgi:limonene 1,2-monooxygenase